MANGQPIALTIRLQSPLLITARQVGAVWESEAFIPGSVIRGAAAEVAQRQGQDLDALFGGVDAPHFRHAYPGLSPCVGVLPRTARTCKRHSGFKRDKKDRERHGVWDVLLPSSCAPEEPESRCCACEQKAEPWGGVPYASVGTPQAPRYAAPQVLRQRIGRTAVARERGAVADQLLYALEILTTRMERDELDRWGRPLYGDTVFHGRVWVPSSTQRWCAWLQEIHHIGGARSRGLGAVEVEARPASWTLPDLERTVWQLKGAFQPSTDSPPGMALGDRILALNRAARAVGLDPDFWYVTLDLESDLVLDGAHGWSLQLEPATLGLPERVELVRSWAQYGEAGGWSAAWGLPKPVAPTLAPGSVFLYRVPTQDDALARQVLERCLVLEQEGIGQRSQEGYGSVQVCTPFHLQWRQENE